MMTPSLTQRRPLIRGGGYDRAIAARQDHYFGHSGLGIQPDEVGGEAGFSDDDGGARVATASRRHRVVYRGEFVETERGELQVRVVDEKFQGRVFHLDA